MAKTLIDLDEDLLAEAAVALGTSTKKDTVAASLRKTVEDTRARRQKARESLEKIAAEGGFHFELLDELDK